MCECPDDPTSFRPLLEVVSLLEVVLIGSWAARLKLSRWAKAGFGSQTNGHVTRNQWRQHNSFQPTNPKDWGD